MHVIAASLYPCKLFCISSQSYTTLSLMCYSVLVITSDSWLIDKMEHTVFAFIKKEFTMSSKDIFCIVSVVWLTLKKFLVYIYLEVCMKYIVIIYAVVSFALNYNEKIAKFKQSPMYAKHVYRSHLSFPNFKCLNFY